VAFLAGLTVVVSLLALSGCESLDDVSGLWRTPEESKPVGVPGTDPQIKARLKLAVGQYGKDVAGVLVFYEDQLFWNETGCWYVHNGKMIGSTFLFEAQGEGGRVQGNLSIEEGEEGLILTGDIWNPDKEDESAEVLLERIGDGRDIRREEWDRGCK